METYCRISFILARATGLLDIYFDKEKQRFILWHKPSLLYSFVLKGFYMGFGMYLAQQVYGASQFCFTNYEVQKNLSLLVACLVIVQTQVICLETFSARKLTYKTLSAFQKYIKQNPHKLHIMEQKWRSKILLIVIIISILNKIPLGMKYAISHRLYCEHHTPYMLKNTMYYTVMLWYLSLILEAYNLGALVTGHTILSQLVARLKQTTRELKLLRNSNLNRYLLKEWRKSLTQNIMQVNCEQRLIQSLLQNVVNSSSWNLLFTLFNRCLQLAFVLTLFVLSLNTRHTGSDRFTYLCFTAILSFSLLIFFYLCQSITNQFSEMKRICHMARLQLDFAMHKDESDLEHSLESLMLELQQDHYRLRFLGVFKLDMAAAYAILSACFMHFLLLLQTMLQYGIDLHKPQNEY